MPRSLTPYILEASTAPKPSSRVVASADELPASVDELPARKTLAKRGREAKAEEVALPDPEPKRAVVAIVDPAPAAPKAVVTTAVASSAPVAAAAAAVAAGTAFAALAELPFPALATSSIAGGVAPISYADAKMAWSTHDGTLLCCTSPSLPGRTRIASFDMDSTLIQPKSGDKFPRNRTDWVWWAPEVPIMLKKLHALGYKIIIFSNQGGISKGKQQESDITGKISDMSAELGLPIQAFCAKTDDIYRKPSPGMFSTFLKHFNGGVPVDVPNSFYVGDAAGRAAGWAPKKKSDFGVGDRKFAINAGLPFQTPEEFFLGHAAVPFIWRSINPYDVISPFAPGSTDPKAVARRAALDTILATLGKKQELILMVGMPASGKSTFTINYLEPKGYVRINRDTLKTPAACAAAVKKALAAGNSAVVDNTNPSAANRADYIKIAQAHGVPVRAFVMETADLVAEHCNLFREKFNGTKHVPDIAYAMFRKHLNAPTAGEGISDIIKVPWVPKFASDADRTLFLQWTE